ncbi:MAG: hypothetical protein ACE5JI_20695 [Acidobacteriota bacterium]
MSRVPVSQKAIHEFNNLVSEARDLLREAREAPPETLTGKLAEAENKLNHIQAMACPVMVFG